MKEKNPQGYCIKQKGCQTDSPDSHEMAQNYRKYDIAKPLHYICYIGDALIAVSIYSRRDEHLYGHDQDGKAHPEKVSCRLIKYSFRKRAAIKIRIAKKAYSCKEYDTDHKGHKHAQTKDLICPVLIEFTHLRGIHDRDAQRKYRAKKSRQRIKRGNKRDTRHRVGTYENAGNDRI